MKTRLQVQDGAGSLPMYKGTADAVRRILQVEGIGGLYSGKGFNHMQWGPLERQFPPLHLDLAYRPL